MEIEAAKHDGAPMLCGDDGKFQDNRCLPLGGRYQIVIRVREQCSIEIGRLGMFRFPAGYYIYTGSAVRSLRARVKRHLRREKRLRWHIDYLLCCAEVVDVRAFAAERSECELAREALSLQGASVPAAGFGASDCRCRSHLVYLGDEFPFERA